MTRRPIGGPACWAAVLAISALAGTVEADDFRTFEGHGGPVMSVTVADESDRLLTASFDNALGLWSAGTDEDPVWLDGHDAAVNRAIFLPGNRAASGGDDFAAIIWDLGTGAPLHRLEGHQGKVTGLAAPADGARMATAAWDGSVRVWDTATGTLLAELAAHDGAVTDVAFSPDGTRLWSSGADGVILEWDGTTYAQVRRLARHGFGVNVLALDTGRGHLAYGAVDGGTRVLDLATGEELADLTAERRPILALALSDDGTRLAVGDGEGYIMVVETGSWRILHDFRAARNGPIWALDFTATGQGVVAGGIANEAMLWPLDGTDSAPRLAEIRREFHTDPDSVSNGERQFLRKCSICHTLGEDGGRRAGPPLAGLFGRPAGAVEGYPYSDAVRTSGIVWTEETIDALFDLGPDRYIPGTKMPVQRIAAVEDRADLIDFLKRETDR